MNEPDSPENEPDSPESEEQSVESVAEPKPSSPPEDNPMATASRSIRPHGLADGLKLATAAARVALDNKASDVAVLDVSAQSAEFDFFVLGTGTSRRQLHAISEQIDDELEKVLGDHRMGIEGYDESRWIVLDYGSVVIHLFDDETREYYDLESLWADAKLVPLADLGLSSSDA
jgi:ribosome-associated protein